MQGIRSARHPYHKAVADVWNVAALSLGEIILGGEWAYMASDLLQRVSVKEVIFIDTGIADWQSLVDGAPEGAEVVTLDPSLDGLAQMAQWAQTHSGYDAIHIISHGSVGEVRLGNFTLDANAIDTRASELAQLGAALNEKGDLLLYGCEVASGKGQDFIASLAKATQADVAASDDLTGAASLGGDWELERTAGSVETATLEASDYSGVLTTVGSSVAIEVDGNEVIAAASVGTGVEHDLSGMGGALFDIDSVNNTITFTFKNFEWNVASFDAVFSGGTLDQFTGINRTGGTAANAGDYTATVDGKTITFNVPINSQASNDTVTVIFTFTSTAIGGNNAPTIVGAPADITVTEDTASNVDLSGVTFADSDGDNLTVTLTASAGTLAASSGGSVTVSGSGTGTLTFSGTATDINSYLDTTLNVQYTGAINASGENAATLTIKVNDGTVDSSSHTVNLDITAVNDTPVFISSSKANVAENTTAVTTLAATDADNDTLTYSLTGGADQLLFNLDAKTGALTFISAPDFETPGDSNTDNAYDVEVTASDGQGGDTSLTLTVNVTDTNEAPTLTGKTQASVSENSTGTMYTATGSDPDNNPLTYTLSGTDAALFDLNANSGALSFKSAPDFEMPGDAGGDNVYDVLLTASDGQLSSSAQALAITVTDVNDANNAPVFTSSSKANVAENTTAVTTLAATDADGDTLTYSLTGGADMGLFSLDANSGALSFKATPDFEAPNDQDQNNQYEVVVNVNDGAESASQAMTIAVTDVNETPPPGPGPTPTPQPIQVTPPEPKPNTPSGQPSLSETISNNGATSGSVRLVENTGNNNVVTATLPGRMTLVHEGARTATDRGLALEDLIASINGKTPTNLPDQTGVASQWLASRPEGTLLDIRTLTFSGTAPSSDPIVLTGTGSGNGVVANQEAFVIDVSGLPQEQQIQLDNIDFASIVGSTTILGGAGDNVVIGDDASQYIVLGAGDDELHGGGGDDTIGSEGGDDRLFGDSGNDELFGGAGSDLLHGGSDTDTVSYAGNREDYVITQDHSVITVQSKADPRDIDTLINLESLVFADETLTVTYEDDLSWITGLYAQVLGRQGDVSGVQYWAQQNANGMSRADIALSILNSPESGRLAQEGSEYLDVLYTGLLGRDADASGKAYWSEQLVGGATLRDVVDGFMFSDEMLSQNLDSVQWDFLI